MINNFPKITTQYFPGDWVFHKLLGDGMVVGVHPNGKIMVRFPTVIQTVEVSDCEHIEPRRNEKRP